MFLAGISIAREGWYPGSYSKPDPTKPLRCTVQVDGPLGKTEINLPPEVGDRIVALIADEIAEQTRRVAEVMTAQFVEASAAPAALPKQKPGASIAKPLT